VTICELIDNYILGLLAEDRSENTIRNYQQDLASFAHFVGLNTKVQAITIPMLRGFFAERRNAGRLTTTLHRLHAAIKSCLAEAVYTGELSRNVAEAVGTPKLRHRLPYCPTEKELLPVLDGPIAKPFSAWPVRDKALLETAYATMCRVDELHSMNVSDIDWNARSIRVIGKGDKERLVLFGEPAELALCAYLRDRELLLAKLGKSTDALFVGCARHSPGCRMSVRRVRSTIKGICVALGMSTAIHPHALRRAGATHMLNRGAGLREINALLGHSKLGTTAGYARLAQERLAKVFEVTHPDNA
jgi:integrase/recombinase XerC